MHRWHLLLALIVTAASVSALRAEPLPETKPLRREGDLAAQMVEGIDKYLMRELAASVEKRKEYWKPDFSSAEAYTKSVQPNRERLKKILGVVDARVSPVEMEFVGTPTQPALVAETDAYKVHAVRWPVLPGVDGGGRAEGSAVRAPVGRERLSRAGAGADRSQGYLVGQSEVGPHDQSATPRVHLPHGL